MQMSAEMSGFLSLGHLALSSVYLDLGNLNEAKIYAEQALNLGQMNHEKYCEGSHGFNLAESLERWKDPK